MGQVPIPVLPRLTICQRKKLDFHLFNFKIFVRAFDIIGSVLRKENTAGNILDKIVATIGHLFQNREKGRKTEREREREKRRERRREGERKGRTKRKERKRMDV